MTQSFNYQLNDATYPVDNVPLPWTDVLGAAAADAWSNIPTKSLRDLVTYYRGGRPISAHVLNHQYGQVFGFTFEKAMPQSAIPVLIHYKQDQLENGFVLAHAPADRELYGTLAPLVIIAVLGICLFLWRRRAKLADGAVTAAAHAYVVTETASGSALQRWKDTVRTARTERSKISGNE